MGSLSVYDVLGILPIYSMRLHDVDENTSLVSIGLGGAACVVALALCGHSTESIGLLAFLSAVCLYIIGRGRENG